MNRRFETNGLYDDDEDISYLYDDELSMTQSASDCSSSLNGSIHFEDSPLSPHSRQHSRRSIRKGLVHALSTPLKVARNNLTHHQTLSPSKRSPTKSSKKLKLGNINKNSSNKNELKNWQEKYNLPPNTTHEQAMAVLLCRELEMIDI